MLFSCPAIRGHWSRMRSYGRTTRALNSKSRRREFGSPRFQNQEKYEGNGKKLCFIVLFEDSKNENLVFNTYNVFANCSNTTYTDNLTCGSKDSNSNYCFDSITVMPMKPIYTSSISLVSKVTSSAYGSSPIRISRALASSGKPKVLPVFFLEGFRLALQSVCDD